MQDSTQAKAEENAGKQHRLSVSKMTFLFQLLELSMQSVVFLALSVMLYFGALGKQDNEFGGCLLIVVMTVFAYICRHVIQRSWLFMASNILMLVAAGLAGQTDAEVFFYLFLTLCLAGYSVGLKNHAVRRLDVRNMPLRDDQREPAEQDGENDALRSLLAGEHISVFFAVIMAAGYIAGYVTQRSVIMNTEAALCIIFIILQIIYNNMRKLYQVYRLNSSKTEFPAQQLKRVNTFVTVAAVLAVLLGMLLFYQGEYGNIFTLAGKGAIQFARLLGWLFVFFTGLFGKEPSEPPELPDETVEETTEGLHGGGGIEEMPDSPLLAALAEAFGMMLMAALLIGIVYVFVVYMRNLNRARSQGQDYIEYIKPKEKKSFEKDGRIHQKSAQTKETKSVRKMYKQLVLKGSKGKIPDAASLPSQLTLENITKNEAQAKKITDIYEKARYSNESISADEIHIFKNLS